MRFVFILSLLLLSVSGLKGQDTIPPILKLEGESNVVVCRWHNYTDLGVSTTDNFDPVSDIKIEAIGNFPGHTKTPGLWNLRYKGTDKAGNVGYSDWRLILVLEANVAGCWDDVWDTTKHPSVIFENYSTKDVSVFPNPTRGNIQVKLNGAEIKEIRLTDLTGKNIPLLVTKPVLSSFSFSLSGLPPGIYLLHIKTERATIVRKILLEQ